MRKGKNFNKDDKGKKRFSKLVNKEELAEMSSISQIALIEEIAEKVTLSPQDNVKGCNADETPADADPPDRVLFADGDAPGLAYTGGDLQGHLSVVSRGLIAGTRSTRRASRSACRA
jgi:hypothetical protein